MRTRTPHAVRIASFWVLAAFLSGAAALGRDKIDTGLLHLVPAEAIFLASNLGKMAQDEAILEMVRASRKRFGKTLILRSLFPEATPEEIDEHHKHLHAALRPFWYNPAVFFVVWDPNSTDGPGVGAYCLPGDHRQPCEDALAALMKVGLPPKGEKGTRQAFTYRSGATTWQGVAKSRQPFELPKETDALRKALEGKTLFLISWSHPVLCVATSLPAADAIGGALPPGRRKGKPILANESLQVIQAKTRLADWAFRWHFNAEYLLGRLKESMGRAGAEQLTRLGLFALRGIGGTGGYADKVFTRRTYLHAPGLKGGLLKAFPPGGSYRKGLSLTPCESTFVLAGQLDVAAVKDLYVGMAMGQLERPPKPEGGAKPGTQPADDKIAKTRKALDRFVAGLDGHFGLFVTDLQSLVGGAMGSGGFPLGAVFGVKDAKKTTAALDALLEVSGVKITLPEDVSPEARAYRKVAIRRVGDVVSLAIVKDRLVFALGDNPMKAAIDAALDDIGGLEEGSEAARLLGLCGEGSVAFLMDLKAIAKLAWPILMQMAQRSPEFFPFASLVSAPKLTRMLGPEVAVIRADEGGLLLSSRGKIPFATKFPFVMFAPMLIMSAGF
jgi:hypothetical protein